MNDIATDAIRLENVTVRLNKRIIFENVQFALRGGDFTYLIGKTGSGKTSLLRLLYADLFPDSGSVRVGPFQVDALRQDEIPFLRRRLGIVFQDFQLLPDRNIGQNIEFVMQATGWKDKKKMRERALDVLTQVGLETRVSAMPHQLSGGEQQRTAIARALVNEPILILADEPTGNLDPEVTATVMDILVKINKLGVAVLMATHEHSLIEKYPGRVLECRDGGVFIKN